MASASVKGLYLGQTNITDEGVASLVAQGALKSLEELNLRDNNQIADASCATLATALRDAALPALQELRLHNNPASQEAQATAQAGISARSGQ